ncbi:hypothetical protein QN277_011889 [Acacia crassicarpa]|uniref:Uncharacterized protein n=1 Tax=Acacia crassicarpa TaxID=499986 RepID=A0AAE1MZI7_9FABA|nr:hypothetical protein QN277_011889 [Acacia crassicarpa]
MNGFRTEVPISILIIASWSGCRMLFGRVAVPGSQVYLEGERKGSASRLDVVWKTRGGVKRFNKVSGIKDI